MSKPTQHSSCVIGSGNVLLLSKVVLLTFALLCTGFASAVLRIEITDTAGVQDAIPIAIVPFANAAGVDTDIAGIIGDDLARSGRFRVLTGAQISATPSKTAEVDSITGVETVQSIWRLVKLSKLAPVNLKCNLS